MSNKDKKIAFFGRFFGKKSVFNGAGKDFRVEKSSTKKSWKNRRFFRNGRFLVDFSAFELHALGRRVRATSFVDLSAIKSKCRRFFGDFSAFFLHFLLNYYGPYIFLFLI